MAKVGTIIKEARRAKRLSLGQLAYQSGVTKGTINQIELGRTEQPKFDTLAKLASSLGLSLDSIAKSTGLMPDNPSLKASDLSGQEVELVTTIRSIPTPNIRQDTLILVIGFATVARDADVARQ